MAKAILLRGVRFSVVGAICTAAAYASFWALAHVIHYQLANLVSWAMVTGLGFVLHRTVTHRISGRDGLGRQLALHMAGSIGQLIVSAVGYAVLIGWARLSYTLGFVLNLGLTASFMFVYMEALTFGRARR